MAGHPGHPSNPRAKTAREIRALGQPNCRLRGPFRQARRASQPLFLLLHRNVGTCVGFSGDQALSSIRLAGIFNVCANRNMLDSTEKLGGEIPVNQNADESKRQFPVLTIIASAILVISLFTPRFLVTLPVMATVGLCVGALFRRETPKPLPFVVGGLSVALLML
jgi:hypothetical protein